MVTKISVCLEVGRKGTGAFVPSCPGCWVFGRTPERALKKVKIAISEWFEWTEKHEEHIPIGTKDFEVEVAKILRVSYNPVEAGKPEPIFLVRSAPNHQERCHKNPPFNEVFT